MNPAPLRVHREKVSPSLEDRQGLVARQIHELGRGRRGPFVAVNCAAIVETLIEAELFGIEDRAATGVRAGRRYRDDMVHSRTRFC